MGKRETKPCIECGRLFESWICQKRKFCSSNCRLRWLHRITPEKKRKGNECLCLFCGKKFYVAVWRIRVNKGKYCSRECYGSAKSKLFKGIGNPQYIDGRAKRLAKAFYLSGEWRRLRKEIYKRDNWTCQKCGKHGGRLHAHHKVPVGICKDPFDKSNITTECQKCHNGEVRYGILSRL